MYDAVFNLTAEPFRLAPDLRFCFRPAGFARARRRLGDALARGAGIATLTGGPGTGKTTLVEDLVAAAAAADRLVVRVVNSQLEPDELLRKVAMTLGLAAEGQGRAAVLHGIEDHLCTRARTLLLVVDEAQGLATDALEAVRQLTNVQVTERPLVQVLLVGQPELRDTLRGPAMEALRQRLVAGCALQPLTATETRQYVAHRLCRVSWDGEPRFSGPALAAIHHFSGGVPRRINQICSRLLLHAAESETRAIGYRDVTTVAAELNDELLALPAPPGPRGDLATLEGLGPVRGRPAPGAVASCATDLPGGSAAMGSRHAAGTGPLAVPALLPPPPQPTAGPRRRPWGILGTAGLLGAAAALAVILAGRPDLTARATASLADTAAGLRATAPWRWLERRGRQVLDETALVASALTPPAPEVSAGRDEPP